MRGIGSSTIHGYMMNLNNTATEQLNEPERGEITIMFKSAFGPNGPQRAQFDKPCQTPGCESLPIGAYWLPGSGSQKPYCLLHATPVNGSPCQRWQKVGAERYRVQCGSAGGEVYAEWTADVTPELETWSLFDGDNIQMSIRMHFLPGEDACDATETFDGPPQSTSNAGRSDTRKIITSTRST